MKSLIELCVDKILTTPSLLSVDNCLVLLSSLDLQHPFQIVLRARILSILASGFPYLLGKYGEEELKSSLDEADWNCLWNGYNEQLQIKERFSYLKGTILERKNIKITQLCDTYPLELLVEGVSWPSNVDVTKREQYLDDDAFYRVFKVTKEDFQKLAKHVKQRLKKEHGLF